MMDKNRLLRAGGLAAAALFFAYSATADEAEDLSDAFQSDLDRIAAERGISDAAATVTVDESGLMSAKVGVSHMKMLMVRKNNDGTLSYEHVSNGDEAEEFVESDNHDEKVAEE